LTGNPCQRGDLNNDGPENFSSTQEKLTVQWLRNSLPCSKNYGASPHLVTERSIKAPEKAI